MISKAVNNINEGSQFPTMTIKGGTSQACAACKYQRRRCNKDCPLAPYFPADQPNTFRHAHRLYGVSNIMKILKQIPPERKREAMQSITYESDIRAKFPVTGCLGIINQLRVQLHHTFEELRCIDSHLAMFRRESLGECSYRNNNSPDTCPSSQLQLGLQTNEGMMQLYQYQPYNAAAAGDMPEYLADGINGVYLEENINESVVKPVRVHEHQFYYGNGNNVDGVTVQHNNMMTSERFPIQQEIDVPQDYDEIPFDTIADDDQYVESKEKACESSAESAFVGNHTQPLEHVSQNDLKSAAAYFSLIS